MLENWKTIEEYSNYAVSDLGNVRNIVTGKVLKPQMSQVGYFMVRLPKDGDGSFHTLTVHRLIAEAFCTKDDDSYNYVMHLDGNKLNNRADNLCWCRSLMRADYNGSCRSKAINSLCRKYRSTLYAITPSEFSSSEDDSLYTTLARYLDMLQLGADA